MKLGWSHFENLVPAQVTLRERYLPEAPPLANFASYSLMASSVLHSNLYLGVSDHLINIRFCSKNGRAGASSATFFVTSPVPGTERGFSKCLLKQEN
jgi:hypothetical protein